MSKKRLIIMILIIVVFLFLIGLSIYYYKDKYEISFETGTDEQILTQYIKKGDLIKEPIKPEKEGYVFIEWQYNGKRYDFSSKVSKDMKLTAKWLKEKYVTVNYVTNSNYEIDPVKILKEDPIDDLPVAYKDGYEFIGWSLYGNLYNGEIINDDVTLIALYKNDTKNDTYKIGDDVMITGSYSVSAYSNDAINKRAIGWNRKILYIIEDANYPYVIGNDYGVTGYFKASSIEIN